MADLYWSASWVSPSSNGRSSSLGKRYIRQICFERLLILSARYRWLAWTCDAIDFFTVSLSVTNLQIQFDRSAHDITTAITLTLLFRSLGAVSVVVQFREYCTQSTAGRLRYHF
jgi:hypothetical protein